MDLRLQIRLHRFYQTRKMGCRDGGGGVKKLGAMKKWVLRVGASVLFWMAFIQWMSIMELWHPSFFDRFGRDLNVINVSVREEIKSLGGGGSGGIPHSASSPPALLPRRMYKNNGYLRVSCNGGLNQMRAAICDMVAISRYLNLTLLVPELDKKSFWADPSDFGDIFDVKHFINSLRDEVHIVKALPRKYNRKFSFTQFSMPPVSWSNEKYYLEKILPLARKHKIIHFNKTDARLTNNNLPIELQKLRCRVNYEALKFTPQIETLGNKLVSVLQKNGFFVVLHLRYEMDMLSFSGCTHGCSNEETDELTKMRYAFPWWKEKEIVSEVKRLDGLCPLTPEETVLVLQALGFAKDTQIYIASGEIYGSQRRLASLRAAYPKIVKKEMLLTSEELMPFHNHSSQMAALDYFVSIASDVFIPSYDGNMARVVEGHRRYLGFRKTITLDRKRLVPLLDSYQNNSISWDEFSHDVREVHKHQMGRAKRRKVIPDKPKEEDYFYSNPQECLGPSTSSSEPTSDI